MHDKFSREHKTFLAERDVYYKDYQNAHQFSLLRYNTNGTLDTSFGKGGQVITPTEYTFNDFKQMIVRTDGKLVVAGTAYSNTYFALAYYNADGTTDNSLGNGGKLVTSTPLISVSYLRIPMLSVTQDRGKFLVAGSVYNGKKKQML